MAKPKRKATQNEVATTNVRIYGSTIPFLQALSAETGKNYPRLIDEKFNPEKYGLSK